jgi:hypothetical protein
MRVFISWSGYKSKKCAEIFAEWLPQVIQVVDPWISTEIEKGSKWTPEISKTLEISKVGIICLTRENLNNKWILFEAGALSKIPETRVCTFLLGLTPTDIEQPLSQFMHTIFDKDDIYKMLLTINSQVEKNGEKSLNEKTLKSVFDVFWPDLDKNIQNIGQEKNENTSQIREDRDILEEILTLVRDNSIPIQTIHPREYKLSLPIAEGEAIKKYNQLVDYFGISPDIATGKVLYNIVQKYQLSPEMAGIIAERLFQNYSIINKK